MSLLGEEETTPMSLLGEEETTPMSLLGEEETTETPSPAGVPISGTAPRSLPP
jgi:hypothetical protein